MLWGWSTPSPNSPWFVGFLKAAWGSYLNTNRGKYRLIVHCQRCILYLVKTPKRMMKHICMKIMKGMCKDIPFGLPSVLYAIVIRVCLPSYL